MEKIKGSVGVVTLITIIGSVIVSTATAVAWNFVYVNSQVAPIAAQEQISAQDISSIKTDLSWVKASLQAKGFSPGTSSSYLYSTK